VIDTLIAYSDDPNNHPLNMQELLPRIQQGLKEISGSGDSASLIRDELKADGIELEDRPDGTTDWRKID